MLCAACQNIFRGKLGTFDENNSTETRVRDRHLTVQGLFEIS